MVGQRDSSRAVSTEALMTVFHPQDAENLDPKMVTRWKKLQSPAYLGRLMEVFPDTFSSSFIHDTGAHLYICIISTWRHLADACADHAQHHRRSSTNASTSVKEPFLLINAYSAEKMWLSVLQYKEKFISLFIKSSQVKSTLFIQHIYKQPKGRPKCCTDKTIKISKNRQMQIHYYKGKEQYKRAGNK